MVPSGTAGCQLWESLIRPFRHIEQKGPLPRLNHVRIDLQNPAGVIPGGMSAITSTSTDNHHTLPPSARRLKPTAVAVAIFLVAIAVRLPPSIAPHFMFETDSAFHSRMIAAVMSTGSLPTADSEYALDPPRDNRRMCPDAFHRLAAFGYSACRRLAPVSFADYLMALGVLCGALTTLPVCAIVWMLTRRIEETALAGAVFAVATPVTLRSAFHVVRYESLGILLILVLAAMLYRWRSSAPLRTRSARILLAAAFVIGLAGAGTWRLFPLLAALLLMAATAADAVAPRTHPSILPPALAAVCGCLAAWPVFEFYRLAGAAGLPLLLAPLAAAAVGGLIRQERVSSWLERRSQATRWTLTVTGLGLLLAGIGAATESGRAWLRPILGMTPDLQAHLSPPVLVGEMLPVDPATFFSWHYLGYLPVLYAAWLLYAARRADGRHSDAFPAVAAWLAIGLTLLFNRMVFIGLPLLLIHLAGGIARLDAVRIRRFAGLPLRTVALGAMLPLLIGFAIQSRSSLSTLAQPSTDRRDTYQWVSAQTVPGTRVAANWSLGYELQWYTPAITIMDGFLESAENRQRIHRFTEALFAVDGGRELSAFCRQNRARYLVVDNTYLLPLCRRLGLPWHHWLRVDTTDRGSRVEILPEGRSVAWLSLMAADGGSRHFRRVFSSGNINVLEIMDPVDRAEVP